MCEQAYGAMFASRVFIKGHLNTVNAFVGTKEKMTEEQIDTLSDQILIEYGGLNLLEFAHFCSRLRSGKYEDFYGCVDPMRVLKSLATYMEDRRYDINRAWQEEEKQRAAKEREEAAKNSVSFDEWVESLPPDEREDVLASWGRLYGNEAQKRAK